MLRRPTHIEFISLLHCSIFSIRRTPPLKQTQTFWSRDLCTNYLETKADWPQASSTMANGKKRTKADLRRESQRKLLFSDVQDSELWTAANQGWCLTPRTMPLVLHAIRALSKGSSAAETYFALWCNCISESVVEMTNKSNLIAAAGYTGHTNERTWKERMKKLEELGFIKISSGKHGDISCVLIPNPHLVLKRHKENGTQNFDEHIYNCILELIADYGMRDFDAPSIPTEVQKVAEIIPVKAPEKPVEPMKKTKIPPRPIRKLVLG